MKTTLPLLMLFILVLGGGYLWSTRHTDVSSTAEVSGTSTAQTAQATADENASATSTNPASASSYTLAQVAVHGDTKSCWSAIQGNVYDLTTWINQHPGGAARILSICGKDGTSAFAGQHGSDPRANAMLATFKIGTLAS